MNPDNQAFLDGLPPEIQVSIDRTCRVNPRAFRNVFGEKDHKTANWSVRLWLPIFDEPETPDAHPYADSELMEGVEWADGDTIDEAISYLRERWQETEKTWRVDYAKRLARIEEWVAGEKQIDVQLRAEHPEWYEGEG